MREVAHHATGLYQEAPARNDPLYAQSDNQWKADGKDTFDKRLAVCNEVKVGRFIAKIDGDRAVVSRRFGRPYTCVTPRSSGLVSG
jgi:hypothetical protein